VLKVRVPLARWRIGARGVQGAGHQAAPRDFTGVQSTIVIGWTR
jgi:hypothetical protein